MQDILNFGPLIQKFLQEKAVNSSYTEGLKEIEEGLLKLSKDTHIQFGNKLTMENLEQDLNTIYRSKAFELALDLQKSNKALQLLESGHQLRRASELGRVKKVLTEVRAVQGEWELVKAAKQNRLVYNWDALIDTISSAKALTQSKSNQSLEIIEMNSLLKKVLAENGNAEAVSELQASLRRFNISHPLEFRRRL